jgi:hypothetical protein
MKQGKVFFHPIEGAGQLSISWSAEPKGNAIEAKKGAGVGFFSRTGELLSVIFDEVQASEDCQSLDFTTYQVEVAVKRGKVSYKVHQKNRTTKPKRSASPRKRIHRKAIK